MVWSGERKERNAFVSSFVLFVFMELLSITLLFLLCFSLSLSCIVCFPPSVYKRLVCSKEHETWIEICLGCKEVTHWKRLWCWEGLGAGGEGDNRGWDGCMASLTHWTWVWVNSRRWWWTGRPGVLRFMGSQRVGHDWATELNWTEPNFCLIHLRLWPVCILVHNLCGWWAETSR